MPRAVSLKQVRIWIGVSLIAASAVAVLWRASSHASAQTTAQTSSIIFFDDFNDNSRDTSKWSVGVLSQSQGDFDSRVAVREQNQRLEITPLSETKGRNYGGYVSVSSFNLTNSALHVEAVQVPSKSQAFALFSMGIDSKNWFRIAANSSTIYFQQKIGGSTDSASLTYDSTQHHYWQIRQDAASGNVVFETSADGTTWTVRRTISPQISITALRIELGGGTDSSVNSPGMAIFNNVELDSMGVTPTPTPTPTPTATPTPTPTPTPSTSPTPTNVFTEDFNDNFRDSSRWNLGVMNVPDAAYNPAVPVLEQNQRLEIYPIANTSTWSHNGYVTAQTFNLTGTNATVEVPQVTGGSAMAIFAVGVDSNNWYRISARSGLIYFQDTVGGTKNSVSITYDAVQHHFWRIRHDSGTDSIYFETSADGNAWTTQRTIARNLIITAMRIELDGGTFEPVSAPGTAIFDNFHLDSIFPTQTAWTKRGTVVNDSVSTHRYSHPQPFELDNGAIIAGFTTNEDSPVYSYKLVRSTDGGNSWGSKVTIVANSNNIFEGAFAQTSATNLVCVYGDGDGVSLKRSSDRGATWGSSISIAAPGGGADAHPSIANLGNNTLLVAYRYNDRILAKKSTDGGATWGSTITVASSTTTPYNSPSVVRLPSGTLVLAFSSGTGSVQFPHVYITRSADGGATWSKPVDTKAAAQYSFNDPNLTLLNNGDLVMWLVNGDEASGIRWDSFMLSHDGGLSWSCESFVYGAGDPHRMNGIQLKSGGMVLMCASHDDSDTEYHITSLAPPANWPTSQCP